MNPGIVFGDSGLGAGIPENIMPLLIAVALEGEALSLVAIL